MINAMNYQDPTVIDEVFKDIQKGEFESADEKLTDNFKSTIMDKEVSKEEYLETYKCIAVGMPDVKFSLNNMSTDGDVFKAKLRIRGTHTKRIPSIHGGVKSIKATGKKVNAYIAELRFRLRGEKIIEISNASEKKGVIKNLLRHLDLEPKKYISKK
jgi:predicted ester cyclase